MTLDKTYLDDVLKKYGHQVFAIYSKNKPSETIYIGRSGKGQQSIFGNPFPMQNQSQTERIKVCLAYKRWLDSKVKSNPQFAAQVKNLHDKNLVCFCSNGTTSLESGANYCHGHILLDKANELWNKSIDN